MKKVFCFFWFLMCITAILLPFGCDKDETPPEIPTLTDIDGNEYPILQIGDQWWMAENLRVTRYRDGDNIPTGLDNADWQDTKSGAYAVYPHDNVDGIDSEAEMLVKYGALYNWYAVIDQRGLCPVGWSVASDDDWKQLEMHLGMSEEDANKINWRGAPVGGKMKAPLTLPLLHPRWNSSGEDVTNESEFSGLPAGTRGSVATFHSIGSHSHWWISAEYNDDNAWSRALRHDLSGVFKGHYRKSVGFSIRCIKN